MEKLVKPFVLKALGRNIICFKALALPTCCALCIEGGLIDKRTHESGPNPLGFLGDSSSSQPQPQRASTVVRILKNR